MQKLKTAIDTNMSTMRQRVNDPDILLLALPAAGAAHGNATRHLKADTRVEDGTN